MATRMLTRRGLRSFAPAIALDREVQSAGKTIQTVGGKTARLVAATRPEEVEDVLTESYLESVSDMALPANPFQNHNAVYLLSAAATEQVTPPGETDLFKKSLVTAAYGTPRVDHDLLEDGKPNSSMLVNDVGVIVTATVEGIADIGYLLNSFRLDFWQDETRLLKIPLAACLMAIVVLDADGTLVFSEMAPGGGGGYEVAGHGLPLVRADKTSKLMLKYFGAAFTTHATAATELVVLVNINGERMEK